MTKKKVLLTGGSGLLGCSSFLTQKNNWDITLWLRNHQVKLSGVTTKIVKLEDLNEVKASLNECRPDLIIHAAGMTNIEDCESNEYRATLSNVISSKNLAKASAELGIKFIFISTDQVSKDCESASEEDIGFPINIYARTKLQAEYDVMKYHPECIIARTNFFTWGHKWRKSLLDFIVDNLREKKLVTLFDDVRFNPLSTEKLLCYLDKLDDAGVKGIFNLSGDDKISKYDFGMMICDVFNLDKNYIKKGTLAGATKLVPRPLNLTIDNSKLKKALSIATTPSMNDFLVSLKKSEIEFKSILDESISPLIGSNNINYGKQSIDDQDFESILIGMDSPWLTQGPKIEKFEQTIAAYTGSRYAVAMANWTCGLHMAVLAAGVKPGDYIITSPLSFVASSNCAVYVGAIPFFVDIDPKTLNMDPVKLEEACKKLGSKLKAIIPVHFAGAPCDMEKISFIAKKYKVFLIEDAAHAIGGKYITGEKIGNNRYSDIVGFSFHPVKNLTTGEGGLITTNDENIYRHLLRLRSHGITKNNEEYKNTKEAFTKNKKNPWYYEMQELGFNFRITDLQCALGVSQMTKLNDFLSRKIVIVNSYDQAFSNLANAKIVQHDLRQLSGNHLYVIQVDFEKIGITRFDLFEKFKQRGINLHVHYIPIYKQPYYIENYPVNEEEFPNTEKYYFQAVTLPVFPEMTLSQRDLVIRTVKELIA